MIRPSHAIGFALLSLAWPQVCLAAAASESAIEAEAEYATEFEFVSEDNNSAELLILSPRLDREPLGGAISAFSQNGAIFLPLATLSRMMEIGIQLGRIPGRAQGFIISEDRRFELNARSGEVFFNGHMVRVDTKYFQLRSDDIYVDSAYLSRWLPVDFEVNTFSAVLVVKPRELIPVQARLAREKKLNNLQGAGNIDRGYRRYANGYQLFDGPFIDTTAFASATQSGSEHTVLGTGYSAYVAADVAYLETNGYIAGTNHEPLSNYRLTAGRKDYYGRLLGPLHAREFAFGSVYTQSLPLVSRSELLWGAYVSNYPLSRPNEVQGHTFRGDLSPGWTVELYEDEFLLDFRRPNETGFYVFEKIPLHLGMNRFTLVFYGPFGEKREETYSFNLADGMTPPGEVDYRATAGRDEFESSTASLVSEFGLTTFLSATAGLSTLTPLQYSPLNRSEQYATLGLRTFAGPVYARSNVALSAQGGTAYEVAGQTRVGTVNLQARYSSADEVFRSEILGTTVDSNLNATVDSQIRAAEILPLNTAFSFDRDHYRNNNTSFRLANRTSTVIQEVSVANRIEQFWTPLSPRLTQGGLSLSRRVDPRGNTRVTGELRYNITPNTKPTGFSTHLTQNFPLSIIGSTGFSREFEGVSTSDLGVAKEFDYFSASLSALYVHPSDKTLFLLLSTGLGYVDAKKSLYAKPHPMGGSGSVIVRSYLDANQNSRWDYDELPVANATILINGIDSKIRTGVDGRAFVDQLAPYQPNDISLLATSFTDTSWVSAIKGVNFIPRPGRIMLIEFPVVPTGELDGTIFSSQGSDTSEQSGVTVELLTLDGNVVRQEISAFDGFYLFQQIPMGRYKLRISPTQLSVLGAQALRATDIELTVASPIKNGNDIVIIVK